MVKKLKKRKRDKCIIIPSTKLLCVNVHKIQDALTCPRLYFWKWVMNIVPKRINLNFWFGSVIHKANEIMAETTSITKIHKGMMIESKKFLSKYVVDASAHNEIALQTEIMKIMVEVYVKLFKKTMKNFNTVGVEIPFAKKMTKSQVILVGTIDAYGRRDKSFILREIKTAARIGNDYFKRLKYDKQINGYAIGLKKLVKAYPKECLYIVFRKPGISVRQNETVDQFLVRLRDDLIVRSDWYFITYQHRYGKQSEGAVEADLETTTFDLTCKNDFLSTKELMKPENWPRSDRRCLDFGTCSYFSLCMNCIKWKLYLRFFKMRDKRYVMEEAELDKKIKINTLQRSMIKK